MRPVARPETLVPASTSSDLASTSDLPTLALAVIDRVPAMMAYWDHQEICRFANQAYLAWFGRTREELLGTTLRELLGPIYRLNLPYIQGALEGVPQRFERQIPRPDAHGVRDSLATYIPDIRDGTVRGFFVHVADITPLKMRERELEAVLAERDRALAEVRTLRGLLQICAACKRIRDEAGRWNALEEYVTRRTEARFSHGLCPTCATTLYPELAPDP